MTKYPQYESDYDTGPESTPRRWERAQLLFETNRFSGRSRTVGCSRTP
ncbi:hypothetical protein [Wenjunlia tyrosinilytica]|uniref:Uncharacterized protein n=1 Tax=Wenjunlia tyrosinilytica TaxID=1544741 RepID=A0A918DWV8_9ACTN|nr:hypothetical protein [Wenjunlia tyrosinilytica]GGO86316.1 hypothetical protein GCM10012280_22140 [Wenjunlia tyrosinilytica]